MNLEEFGEMMEEKKEVSNVQESSKGKLIH